MKQSKAHLEIDPLRRRLLATAAAVPLLAAFANARAASTSAEPQGIPQTLLDLDFAAMALFNAAQATRWDEAGNALSKVEASAATVANLEAPFSEAGGQLERFFEATNHLTSDLIDARAAESVRDRDWLLASANNILSRAGDLTEPFARRTEAVLPRIEVLLVLALRMRQALDWQDDEGFEAALRDFNRLWPKVRGQVAGRTPGRVQTIEQALASIEKARTVENLSALSAAVQGLGETSFS